MSEVFTIASSIANTGKEALDIAEAMAKADGSASHLETRLLNIRKLMLVGKTASDWGSAGLDMVSKLQDASKELSNQLALMNALGMSHADILAARSAAEAASAAVMTTTTADNLKTLREMQDILGGGRLKDIGGVLPTVGRLATYLEAHGQKTDGLGADMAKALVSRPGAKTPEGLARNAELMSRAVIASDAQVTVGDFQSVLKQAVAGGWNNEFLYGYLPKMIQQAKATGGDAAGVVASLAAVSKDVHAGGGRGARPLWTQSGLVDRSGAVKDVVKFDHHPFAWVNEDLRPAVERLMASKHVSAETAIHAMFTDKAANRVYGLYANGDAYKAAQANTDRLSTGKVYQSLRQQDQVVADRAEQQSKIEAEAQAGVTTNGAATGVANAKASLWRSLGSFASNHPAITKFGMVGLAAGSAALKVGGEALQVKILFDILGVLRKGQGAAGGLEAAEKGGSWLLKLLGKGKAVEGAGEAVGDAAKLSGQFVSLSERMGMAGGSVLRLFKAFGEASKLGAVVQGVDRILGAARLIPMVLTVLATGLEIGAAVILSPITWIVVAVALVGVAIWQIVKHFDVIKAALGAFWGWLSGLPAMLFHMLPGFAQKGLKALGFDPDAKPKDARPAVAPPGQSAVAAAQAKPPAVHAPAPPRHGPAAAAPAQRPNLVAPRLDVAVHVQRSPVYLDGKKVGEMILHYMAKQAGRAQGGTSSFDPTMGLSPVGMGYGF